MNRFVLPLMASGRVCVVVVGAVLAAPVSAALPIAHWVHPTGAKVFVVSNHALPMVDMQMDIDAGARRDPEGQTGLAAATAMLLPQGVRSHAGRPALDENGVVEAWADWGAQFSVSATADRMSFRLRTLSQDAVLQGAMALSSQQIAAPRWDGSIWQRDRQRLIASWQNEQERPDVRASQAFHQAVYQGHPYGRTATPHTWGAIRAGDISRFYARHARACEARITVVGDVDTAQAHALVDQWLQALPAVGCASLPPVLDVAALPNAVHIVTPMPEAQAHIWVGQPGMARNDPDFLPLLVGNHILGGSGFTSRLMQDIREQRGLTYGVQSFFSPGRHAGAFAVTLQTRPDQAELAVQLIHEHIARFVQEGPSAQELEQAQAALINGFALRLDTNRKLLDNLAALAWNDLPIDYLDTWTQHVQAITAEQIRVAFARVLQPERMVTVVLGAQP